VTTDNPTVHYAHREHDGERLLRDDVQRYRDGLPAAPGMENHVGRETVEAPRLVGTLPDAVSKRAKG
jgi:hypothetical protein